MANPFLDIRSKAGDTQRSLQWYQAQVRALGNIRPNRLMTNTVDLERTVMPGMMYMFYYEAKLKDKLPYWDKFPLVLPFRRVMGGFYGINLHYLPYGMRFRLLGALHEYATDEKINEETRIRVNWRILVTLSSVAPVKACVKHYLFENVQSRFLHIKYPDWVTAALLPVERFENAEKTTVWKDTRKLT